MNTIQSARRITGGRGCLTALVVMLAAAGCTASGAKLSRYPKPLFDTKPRRPTAYEPQRIVHPPRLAPAPRLTPDRAHLSIGPVTIVVDAGHGGRDPGALGVGPVPEKTVNLNIAMILAEWLEAAGANVITTRDDDRFVSLDDRADLAEREWADLFVSIHADAARRSAATGATVYIARGASAQSLHAAESIIAAMERAGIECRGIHQAGFRVLVGHSRPAVLVECGFLTNSYEAQKLSTSAYQMTVAGAIAEGLADHFGD